MKKASSWFRRVGCGRSIRSAAKKTSQRRAARSRRVFFEPLEDRRLLATIVVTSLLDNMDMDGEVTLREAIEAANTNSSVDGSAAGGDPGPLGTGSDDEIVFEEGLTGTIDLNGTELIVTDGRLKIIGPGRDSLTIDAHQNSRHFRVEGFGLTVDGLTLTGGHTASNGGSILSGASLTVQNSTLRNNQATNGGAIHGSGSVVIENSTIQANSAVNGGGIYVVSGGFTSLKITASTVANNDASGSGGGIYSQVPSLITNSTISTNSAGVGGGGVQGIGALGHVNLENSTVSGNEAGVTGGGVGVESGGVIVSWSTVAKNRVTAANGKGGGIYLIPGETLPGVTYAPLTLRGSIIAQNLAAEAPDLTGPQVVNQVSHSLVGNNAGTFFVAAPVGSPTIGGSLIGAPGAVIDPLLAPLANNGGPTETHALLTGSPAIDASFERIVADLIPVPMGDQRGFPRQESRMDMGAFELTQPLNFYDDGTFALWANNPLGFVELPVSLFHNSLAVGTQPYQAVELFHQVSGTSSYPLVFADLVGNTFSRLAYLRADGAAVPFGTSTVGTASFRTNDQRFHYVPQVSRADVTTGGSSRYQSVVAANFGGLGGLTSTRSFLSPTIGRSASTVALQFNALQNIALAPGSRFRNNDRFRLFTASSMFNDESNFDADVLRYETAAGDVETLVLTDLTPTDAYLLPTALEIGSWFELVKTGGSAWFPDSPTTRITIDNKHGLRLGLQGYLQQSADNNDDSLSVWLEWLDAPDTVPQGTTLNLDVTVTATAPGTPGLVVSESNGGTVVSETGTTDTFTVALTVQPRSNVVIDISSDDTGEATVGPMSLTFTPKNWDRPQTVTVTGVPDAVIDGDQVSVVTLQVNQGASDTAYRSVANRAVEVTTTNIDQPAIPTITWNAPADITYGTPLDDTQLDAMVSVPGTFVYSPASGALLNAGLAQQLSVTFTPDDTTNYTPATASVMINVQKADPVLTWNDPAEITYGTLLDDSQLNAAADVPGTFVYLPASGERLNAGGNQSLNVSFTPADTNNYNEITASVTIDVLKADPVISWENPDDIVFGTLLGDSQLDAVADVAGDFTYTPASGTQLDAGIDLQLGVSFVPADAANYNPITASVSINVTKAIPEIMWSNPDGIVFGTPLSDAQLNATANIDGSFAYSPAPGTNLNAGEDQVLQVTFTPTDTGNFQSAAKTVTIDVAKAESFITWDAPADIKFGTLLDQTQLNAQGDRPGSYDYTPAAGTQLNVGNEQPLSVTFTPDDTNFASVTAVRLINVLPADADFGDAPSGYPVTLVQDGARHVPGSLWLGSTVDAEPDGQPTSDATGDGADEDGVLFAASLVATSTTATKSSVAVTASGAGKLDAWIDFNQDGDWDDVGEQIFSNQGVFGGSNLISFVVPARATSGQTAARFRLSSAGGLAPTGAAVDGEVEDYMVSIRAGDASSGTTVDIQLIQSGAFAIITSGNDLVVLNGAIELFRAPGTAITRLDLHGLAGGDTLNLANVDAVFSGFVGWKAGAGNDTLRLTGGGQILDLTQLSDADIQELETIDITGSGDNTLTLNLDKVVKISSLQNTLRTKHDDGDTINYGPGWKVQMPQIIDGQYVHVLTQAPATLHVVNTTPFRNPLQQLDTNRDGSVSPLDALVVVNRLNDSGPGSLSTPTSVAGLSEFFYVDTNGDRSVSPVDVLLIVNFINDPLGNTEAESTTFPVQLSVLDAAGSASLERTDNPPSRVAGLNAAHDISLRLPMPRDDSQLAQSDRTKRFAGRATGEELLAAIDAFFGALDPDTMANAWT